MNELIEKEELDIENMIYEIRGKQVMLDSDVATLFKYETKNLNRQVQRNINRFPDNYCFKLTEEEWLNLKCQNGTSSLNGYGGRRYTPYVYTEYGITMLAGILKSDVAISASLKIVNTFIAMRKYISSNNYERRISNLETKSLEYDNKFNEVFNRLDKSVNNHIFFSGQIYDAYSLLLDILESSKESIVIIDNYADKKLLDLLSKTSKRIKVYSKNMNGELINKYQSQYENVEIIENNSFHDRFIIIDNKELYHCGASFKELGKKCFEISKIENDSILIKVLEELGK